MQAPRGESKVNGCWLIPAASEIPARLILLIIFDFSSEIKHPVGLFFMWPSSTTWQPTLNIAFAKSFQGAQWWSFDVQKENRTT
jgi:hypothetical protein